MTRSSSTRRPRCSRPASSTVWAMLELLAFLEAIPDARYRFSKVDMEFFRNRGLHFAQFLARR